jgi:ribosomal protein L24
VKGESGKVLKNRRQKNKSIVESVRNWKREKKVKRF